MKNMIKMCSAFIALCLLFTGCQSAPDKNESETPKLTETVSVAMLKGPTGVGALSLMEQNEQKKVSQPYDISILSAPDEVTAGLLNGDYQIAALPSNVAAMLYQKSEGEIRVAAINTLGTLYIVENGNEIKTIQDLAGKTLYASGQGATPEYAIRYILEKNGISDVEIVFMQDHAELAAAILANKANIALLPEPNVSSLLEKSPDVRIALDINKEWESIEPDAALAMGCIAVRTDFYEAQPEAVNAFLEDYKKSVAYANENVSQTAALAVQYEVIQQQTAAEKAIPNCSIVYIDKQEMKEKLSAFYEILFQANPKSIGGELPDEAFYITK